MNFGWLDGQTFFALQKKTLETCESTEKQQYALKKDCWQLHRTKHNRFYASKLQGVLQPEKSVFQRKVGKFLRTYYARRRKTWESTESPSHLRVTWDSCQCCSVEQRMTDRRGKHTHSLAPERQNRSFGFHSDQTRVRSMNIKSGKRVGYKKLTCSDNL